MRLLVLFFLCLFIIQSQIFSQTTDSTYAEKLGYPKGAKVVILHVDDAGMSYDSNEGAEQALTKGLATSCSVMMPCGWVPGFVQFLKQHPEVDAGLHLTLTSEWKEYRWVPLAGKKNVPGLVDKEGALWSTVDSVATHATAAEVETEIKAQLDRALQMGFTPTHFDSHMGTLFARADYTQAYMKLGMENHIPVMMPGGHATLIMQQMHAPDVMKQQMQFAGKVLWNAGLPVLDDLYNESYEWNIPADIISDTKKLQQFKTQKYTEALKALKPGLTMIIMHCTLPTETFNHISDSGPTRYGDLLAMLDPAFKKALENEKITLTTWREVMKRRQEK